ncbi:MAG: hypothetical protein RJA70_2023 [Pseudomonadota bacterium]
MKSIWKDDPSDPSFFMRTSLGGLMGPVDEANTWGISEKDATFDGHLWVGGQINQSALSADLLYGSEFDAFASWVDTTGAVLPLASTHSSSSSSPRKLSCRSASAANLSTSGPVTVRSSVKS